MKLNSIINRYVLKEMLAPFMIVVAFFLFVFLMMTIFWIIVIFIIGYVIYLLLKNAKIIGAERSTAADILKKRYAKGEITKEQFEEMKKNISSLKYKIE